MAMVWRVAAVGMAAVIAAWFALGIHQAVDTSQATALITGPSPLSAARAAHARALLSSAATLNPDQTVNVLRGELAMAQNQNAAAQQILVGVTRSEPQNLDAWIQLAYAAARNRDRRLLVLTGRRISGLYPKLH
jgi:predicted Zn-dependent protease